MLTCILRANTVVLSCFITLQVLYLVDQKLRSVFSIMLIGKEIELIELVLNPVTVIKINGDIALLLGRIFLAPLK